MNDFTARFDALIIECRKIKTASTRDAVDALLDSARTNADDTVYAEKAALPSEWNTVFIGTLQSLLTEPGVIVAAKRWFANRHIVG